MKVQVALTLAAITLSGCATATTRVTRFHQLPKNGSGQTFDIVCLKDGGSKIEQAGYSSLISRHLEKYGWRAAVKGQKPDYWVGYTFGISGGKEVHGASPIFGQTGGGTTFHSGTFNAYGGSGNVSGSVSGTSYSAPTYGVVGVVPYRQTLYTRWFMVAAKDAQAKEIFDTRCHSTGNTPEISQIMPAMIDSAFADFPGISGKTRTHERAF